MPVNRKMTASFYPYYKVDAGLLDNTEVPEYLEFVYTNWHGIDHIYIVAPECVEWARYEHGDADRNAGEETWLMNAQVISRSGEDRPGRRTFIMSKMRHIREVPA